jgi:hypothetical protein
MIVWNEHASVTGTSLRGYLNTPWNFTETVARLIALSGQDPTKRTDGYKVSVEFIGLFDDDVFTLYDYKEDNQIHIGGHGELNTVSFEVELIKELEGVTPAPYTAQYHYETSETHGY